MQSFEWSVYSIGQYSHLNFPGSVHGGQIYLTGNPEVFDPVHNAWSNWTRPIVNRGYHSCLLTWKDSLLLMGGEASRRTMEQYHISNQTWTAIDTTIPMDIYGSGCIVLPNDEILVLGSWETAYEKSAAVYNVEDNEWTTVQDSSFHRSFTAFVVLGKRVFATGGGFFAGTEEFDYESRTWSTLGPELLMPRRVHSMIGLPADLFQHLSGGCEGVQ